MISYKERRRKEAEKWKRAEEEKKWKEEELWNIALENQKQNEMEMRWGTSEMEEDLAAEVEQKRRAEARLHEKQTINQLAQVAQAKSSKEVVYN